MSGEVLLLLRVCRLIGHHVGGAVAKGTNTRRRTGPSGQLIHIQASGRVFRLLITQKYSFNGLDLIGHHFVFFSALCHRLYGMHDGGVVSPPKIRSNLFQAVPGVSTSKSHTQLSWHRYRFVSTTRQKIGEFEVVVVADGVHDVLDAWS